MDLWHGHVWTTFLFKFHQQVHAVFVSFRNNAVDELTASVGRILEIRGTSCTMVYSAKEKPQTELNDVTEFCTNLTGYLSIRDDRRHSQTPQSSSRKRSVSRSQTTLIGAGIIISPENLRSVENPVVSRTENRLTRKMLQEITHPVRVNGSRSRQT